MSLTRALREELARGPVPTGPAADAETAACLRYGGVWVRRGGNAPGWVLQTSVAALARRVRARFAPLGGVRTELEVQRPGELAREARYRLRIEGSDALQALGLLRPDGGPRDTLAALPRSEAVAYVRGALMAAGHLSGAGRAPHLEIRAPSERAAADLVRLSGQLATGELRSAARGEQGRVVAKSGRTIGAVLATVGAHRTFLEFDQGLLQRQLRGAANRAANADRANVSRAVTASSRQVSTVEALLARVPLEELPAALRDVALARLANPDASLTELSRLLDAGRATVHRRLARLEAWANEVEVRSG